MDLLKCIVEHTLSREDGPEPNTHHSKWKRVKWQQKSEREREKKLFHSTVVNDAYTSRRKEMQNAYSNNNNVR